MWHAAPAYRLLASFPTPGHPKHTGQSRWVELLLRIADVHGKNSCAAAHNPDGTHASKAAEGRTAEGTQNAWSSRHRIVANSVRTVRQLLPYSVVTQLVRNIE